MKNTLPDNIFIPRKLKNKILFRLVRKKRERKRFLRSSYFLSKIIEESPIEQVELTPLLSSAPRVVLDNFLSRNGNVSAEELLCLSSVIADRKPKRLLEIGTFDGNTTLQMALNAPDGAVIHTLDLPPGATTTAQPVLGSDVQFIEDEAKQIRKFIGHPAGEKVVQHLGDSTHFDFSEFTREGLLDFIFIDGGHSYECVKSDTENALKVLAPGGTLFWHDFTPLFGGVYQYLCSLAEELPLKHIHGTHLVTYSTTLSEH